MDGSHGPEICKAGAALPENRGRGLFYSCQSDRRIAGPGRRSSHPHIMELGQPQRGLVIVVLYILRIVAKLLGRRLRGLLYSMSDLEIHYEFYWTVQ
jgi:hypothetical protein